MKNIALLSAGFMSLSLSYTASAAPAQGPDLVKAGNRWTITAYDDSSTIHQQWATQGICFYYAGTRGTHQLYYWVSDTFPDWNGRATQEGDQIVMHGDYARNVGHDGMEWELTTMLKNDEGFGHWHEWREDSRYGRTIGFLNTKLKRVGNCRWRGVLAEAESYSKEIPYKLDKSGYEIVSPMGFSKPDLERLLQIDDAIDIRNDIDIRSDIELLQK